ncbi:hypothetical protein F5887DRAFT_915818 [Amanita rubescens]|nr:hypothetical protein F5887DRAFT_915818 [Amanita rubescens]
MMRLLRSKYPPLRKTRCFHHVVVAYDGIVLYQTLEFQDSTPGSVLENAQSRMIFDDLFGLCYSQQSTSGAVGYVILAFQTASRPSGYKYQVALPVLPQQDIPRILPSYIFFGRLASVRKKKRRIEHNPALLVLQPMLNHHLRTSKNLIIRLVLLSRAMIIITHTIATTLIRVLRNPTTKHPHNKCPSLTESQCFHRNFPRYNIITDCHFRFSWKYTLDWVLGPAVVLYDKGSAVRVTEIVLSTFKSPVTPDWHVNSGFVIASIAIILIVRFARAKRRRQLVAVTLSRTPRRVESGFNRDLIIDQPPPPAYTRSPPPPMYPAETHTHTHLHHYHHTDTTNTPLMTTNHATSNL